VIEDQTLRQLKDAWLNARWEDDTSTSLEGEYQSCLKTVKGIRYTANDVEKFSLALAEFQNEEDFDWKAGVFLSALINNCPDSDFVIYTKHLDGRIDDLGYSNTKNITINGDARDNLGCCMAGGKITVKGNSGAYAGTSMENGEIVINGDSGIWLGFQMKGGKITVNGNAMHMAGRNMENGEIVINGRCGDEVGYYLLGGKITVNGNAGKDVGSRMQGGEIRIEGDYESLALTVSQAHEIKGGKIYHKGKLVFPRGDEDAG
jgi:hypothetical protein